MKYTENDFIELYNVSRQVYLGALTNKQGVELLQLKGLNKNTASDGIYQYGCLIRGSIFKRSISTKLLSVYLESIYRDNGMDILTNAMNSINLYMENLNNKGKKLSSIRKLYNEVFQKYYVMNDVQTV
jgi:hypothetical protein